MGCCDNRRATFRQAPIASASGGSAEYRPLAPVEFEYTGHGQLSVTGLVTGVVYRFPSHGHRRQVHGADAAGIRSIPSLRTVR